MQEEQRQAGKKYAALPGNLIFYEGKVISQNAYRVTAYPQLKVKLTEMNDKIAKNPRDPIGLTERAGTARNKGDAADAVEDPRALANNPNAEILPKARQLRVPHRAVPAATSTPASSTRRVPRDVQGRGAERRDARQRKELADEQHAAI